MTGDDTARELIPIGPRPAEFVNHRSIRQRSIGSSSGDNNLRTLPECSNNRASPEVDVRTHDPVSNRVEFLTALHVIESDSTLLKCIEAPEYIIALHDPYPEALNAEFSCNIKNRISTALRIYSAAVRHNLNVLLNASRENRFHQRDEVLRVSQLRILHFLLLHDGHRDFSQVVHHHVVDGAFVDLIDGSIGQITPKTLTARDSDLFLHPSIARDQTILMCNSFSCCGSTSEGDSSMSDIALVVFGNAITSRIDFSPVKSIQILSNPNAMPPWGGAPYRKASSMNPNFFFA